MRQFGDPVPRSKDLGMEVVFDRDCDISTLWSSARLMKVAPINNEMLLNYIGEHVPGLPKSY